MEDISSSLFKMLEKGKKMYNRGQSTMLECLLDQGVLGKIGIVDPFYK